VPAESKAQLRFMQAMLHGAKPKGGRKPPSKKVVREYTKGVSAKDLPEKKKKAY